MERMMFWAGADSWQAESSEVRWSGEELTATGTQFGVDPVPYRLDYTLKTGGDFVTESLEVAARGEQWNRRLRLIRGSDGKWTAEVEHAGEVDLPAPGGDLAAVTGRSIATWVVRPSPISCHCVATACTSSRVRSTS